MTWPYACYHCANLKAPGFIVQAPQTQVSLASIKPLAEGFAIAEVDLLGTRIAFHVAMVDPIFAQHVLGERAAAGDRQHVFLHGVVLRDELAFRLAEAPIGDEP